MKIKTKTEALNIVETSYLASLSSLLWVALYYLPIGGALLRLILPLPMILLHLRRGSKIENLQNNLLNKNDINLEKENKKFDDKKNKKIKNLSKKRKIELQSYKIIFILKDVDPKDPIEELSTILSNSEVNFEIEKIERILDSKK